MFTTQEANQHQLLLDLSKHPVKLGLYFVSIFGQFLMVDPVHFHDKSSCEKNCRQIFCKNFTRRNQLA